MAEPETNSSESVPSPEPTQVKTKSKRYVGSRETLAYILFDVAASVGIGKQGGEFTDRILNISKGWQAAVTPITTAWDIINDLFVAAFVEKTRTRFGKFRPWLIAYPIYGIPMTMMSYLLPYIFWGTDAGFLPKIITWAVLNMFNEMTGTLNGICRTGMVVNITPDPGERLLLINKANFWSMFGEELPQQIFSILMDVIARQTAKFTKEMINLKMRRWFLIFGEGTIIISGLFSLWFAWVSRERVVGTEQSREKPPTIRESFIALRKNRPLFMLMISEILGGFSIKGQMSTYTNSILNFRNFGTVMGIPGAPISYIAYAWVPPLRRKFSTKFLWLAGNHIMQPFNIIIYFLGLIRRKGQPLFLQLVPMLIIYAVYNCIHMCVWPLNKVIGEEIRNECIDYGEWKSGMRSEAMVGTLRSFPSKITNAVGSTVTNAIMEMIGFQTGLDYNNQSEKTAQGVFAMATIIPTLSGLIGLIPKLFFNINQKDREQMYAELAERRARIAAEMNAQIGE
ncbi:MAG: MFS transporter [Oscillospiraceae bacterium]|jgi:Na+/melibiose symporter-like transporter|nr:MFS transporter [Oscillospiraceae bacterium]